MRAYISCSPGEQGKAKEIEMDDELEAIESVLSLAIDLQHEASKAYGMAYYKYRADPTEENRVEARRLEAEYKEAKAFHRAVLLDRVMHEAQEHENH